MGFTLEEVINYLCECDTCGRVAKERRVSKTGNKWDENKWAKLAIALRKLGWKSKKVDTVTIGLSRNWRPVYEWDCPECAAKKKKAKES